MSQVFVGIDVSQDALDVAVLGGPVWQVPYTDEGTATVTSRLHALSPRLVVLEATGGLETPLAAALALAQLPVAVVNPRQVRDFARATGLLAKTDRLDAQVLARFGEAVKPPPRPLPDALTQELSALLTRRRQVVEMLVMETNRLRQALPRVRPAIQAHIAWLRGQQGQLDQELDALVQESPLWRAKEQLFRSMRGVGPVLARTLLAHLPELGTGDAKRLCALVGIAPFNRDSGTLRGKRTIWGGRASVRTALYMAAVASLRWNPTIRTAYARLVARGKPPKVAVVACMRKMLVTLHAMAKTGTPWRPPVAVAS